MAELTPRQQKAAALTREISRLGGFVINPLPLRDDERELRVQILDKDKHVVQEIESWGWRLTFGYPLPRMSHASFVPASVYRLEIPMERIAVVDDRVIKGDGAIE